MARRVAERFFQGGGVDRGHFLRRVGIASCAQIFGEFRVGGFDAVGNGLGLGGLEPWPIEAAIRARASARAASASCMGLAEFLRFSFAFSRSAAVFWTSGSLFSFAAFCALLSSDSAASVSGAGADARGMLKNSIATNSAIGSNAHAAARGNRMRKIPARSRFAAKASISRLADRSMSLEPVKRNAVARRSFVFAVRSTKRATTSAFRQHQNDQIAERITMAANALAEIHGRKRTRLCQDTARGARQRPPQPRTRKALRRTKQIPARRDESSLRKSFGARNPSAQD